MTLRLEEYLKDPCGTLSIPYWKWKAYAFSDMIEIVHKREIKAEANNVGEAYFRLYHDLSRTESERDAKIHTVNENETGVFARMIDACYSDITDG